MKYWKVPVKVEASRWFRPGDHAGVDRFCVDNDRACSECEQPLSDHGRISTLEGYHIVCPGDWIITDVEGEEYPCKPRIFEKAYDPVTEELVGCEIVEQGN